MPVLPSSPLHAWATRRTTLTGLLLGVGALGACDADLSGGGSGGSGPTPAGDPDRDLVDAVLADLGQVTDLVTATAAAHPRLREPLASLRALHLAHAEALGGPASTPGAGAQSDRPAASSAAMAAVHAQEVRLQRRLVEAAVHAESGALARLLASMSAAVTQQLAVLPASVTR